MLKLPLADIIANIEAETTFEAVCDDYSFTIKIEHYAPYLCAAIHDGHQFRKSLWSNCLHTEYERWYEEDPCTKQMIASHPIVLAGCDSRFEYDLNRSPETAIYEDAWGKKLWKKPLSEKERKLSLQKHANFYRVVHALVAKLEEIHGKSIIFDMHSYNWKRWNREVPTWNLGTANINTAKYEDFASAWCTKLGAMKLPNGIKSSSKINDTFQGNGFFLKYISSNFKNTLVLATEISKIYCDEYSAIIYPEVVQAVTVQLQELVSLQAKEFQQQA